MVNGVADWLGRKECKSKTVQFRIKVMLARKRLKIECRPDHLVKLLLYRNCIRLNTGQGPLWCMISYWSQLLACSFFTLWGVMSRQGKLLLTDAKCGIECLCNSYRGPNEVSRPRVFHRRTRVESQLIDCMTTQMYQWKLWKIIMLYSVVRNQHVSIPFTIIIWSAKINSAWFKTATWLYWSRSKTLYRQSLGSHFRSWSMFGGISSLHQKNPWVSWSCTAAFFCILDPKHRPQISSVKKV